MPPAEHTAAAEQTERTERAEQAEQTEQTERAERDGQTEQIDEEAIAERVLALAAEQTGYPQDMLELDLDLEADLGIDTVKQAELFAAIRDTFTIPRPDELKLSDYPTLGHVIGFVRDQLTTPAEAAPQSAEAAGEGGDLSAEAEGEGGNLSAEASGEGGVQLLRPELVGRPPAADCLPTGARLQGRVLVVGGPPAAAAALEAALRQGGAEPLRIGGAEADAQAVLAAAREALAAGPLQGAVLLTALAPPTAPDSEDRTAWRSALDARTRLPFLLAQTLEQTLTSGEGTFFLALTAMGGHLGLAEQGARDPLAGATTGLIKALAREWPGVCCKVVDTAADAEAAAVATVGIEEIERDPAVVEVGRGPHGRYAIGLRAVAAEELAPARPAAPAGGPVVLISGGGGAVAGHIARAAARGGGTFYLLGRTAAPIDGDPQLQRLQHDPAGLERELADRMRSAGERPTPVKLTAALASLKRQLALRRNLAAIEAAGARAHYVALDATDADAVGRLVAEIVERHGRLDQVWHAAGIEHSRPLAKKEADSFDRVLDAKAEGLRALLRATRNTALERLVLFGSVAGRFGNASQTDYAAANDLLAKCAGWIGQQRPGLVATTLAFSAWGGAGMASRGSAPALLRRAGIGLIAPAAGAAASATAMAAGLSGELVLANGLGALADGLRAGGADLAALRQRLAAEPERYPMLQAVADWTVSGGLELEVDFDPQRDPYLADHRIDGTIVVPGVMAVECFAEAAQLLRPELELAAVEAIAFDAPLKLYRDAPRAARLRLQPLWSRQQPLLAVRLESERELAGGRRQTVCHFRARVRLGAGPRSVGVDGWSRPAARAAIDRDTIYRTYFHGPSFQVLDGAEPTADGGLAGRFDAVRAEPPLGRPGRLAARPMLTELAFQAAGLHEARVSHRIGLPAALDRLSLFQPPPGEPGPITARVLPAAAGAQHGHRIQVIDGRGYLLLELDGYRTAPLPQALDAALQASLTGAAGGPAKGPESRN